MNRLTSTQQYATNTTQSHLNSSNNQNLGYAEKDTTNKNLQDVPTSNKNIKATPPTKYITNYSLEPYNTEQNSLNPYFQNINPVNLSINSNTNINHQSNSITTATITTNSFCTKKTTSILHTKIHAEKKPYKCSYQDCDKKFTKKSNLQRHIRIHTEEKNFKCTDKDCNKAFKQKYHLQQHIRTHTGEKPFKCTGCGKSFNQKSNLTNHIRTHTGDRPYKCTGCSKAFSRQFILTEHIKTHTGEKPFKCIECSKAFSRQFILTEHIKTHTGEKPYKCIKCSKAFTRQDILKRHIKIHTGERPYKCTECEKKFSQKNHLKRHISRLHSLKEVLKYKKKPLQCTYNQPDNTSKQNECFQDNSLHKDQSLIVNLSPLNVSKAVSKIAPKIITKPEVNVTSDDEIMIIKTEPLDSEYNQGSFFKKRSYEHKIDNTLPILQDPNNSSKSLLQDKLKWFKKLTYQNFLDLQSYIINKSSIKNYKIIKSQSNIIKILKKIKQLINWSTLELHINSEEINDNEFNFVKDKICIEIIEWLFLNEYNIEKYTHKLNNYVTSIIPIDDKAERGVSVFANNDINKFDVIGTYAGALVNDEELNNRYEMYGEANICSYLFGTKFKTLAIDGYMTGNILSCVNTAKLSNFAAIGENNLMPIIFANYMIFFVAIKHIPKNTELFINYGDCYKTREEIKLEMTED